MDESEMTDLLKSVRNDLEALVDAGLTGKSVLAEFDETCCSDAKSDESGGDLPPDTIPPVGYE